MAPLARNSVAAQTPRVICFTPAATFRRMLPRKLKTFFGASSRPRDGGVFRSLFNWRRNQRETTRSLLFSSISFSTMAVNTSPLSSSTSSQYYSAQLNRCLPARSPSIFFHRTSNNLGFFNEGPRLVSFRSQALDSGFGDSPLDSSSGDGFGSKGCFNLDTTEATAGSSSVSSSSSPASAIDFLTLCHRLKVIVRLLFASILLKTFKLV